MSLYRMHPHRKDITFLIMFSLGTYIASLLLPVLEVKTSLWFMFMVDKITFMDILSELVWQDHYALALLILTFSLVFPALKFAVLLWTWIGRPTERQRRLGLGLLKRAGKWSMVDVFVVAVFIIAVKMDAVAKAEARVGIYALALSVLASMVATAQVDKLVKRTRERISAWDSRYPLGNDVY